MCPSVIWKTSTALCACNYILQLHNADSQLKLACKKLQVINRSEFFANITCVHVSIAIAEDFNIAYTYSLNCILEIVAY